MKIENVDPSSLIANAWNPNVMNAEIFAKEVESINQYGFIQPVVVRESQGFLEIIDGEHRTRAAISLGLRTIPIVNMGAVPDPEAKKLTIILNELRGRAEPLKLARVFNDLLQSEDLGQMLKTMPYYEHEINALMTTFEEFHWNPPDAEPKYTPPTAGRKRVVIGAHKGEIPDVLYKKVTTEFERTAASIGSDSLERIIEHWVDRLALDTLDPGPKQNAKRTKVKL